MFMQWCNEDWFEYYHGTSSLWKDIVSYIIRSGKLDWLFVIPNCITFHLAVIVATAINHV